MVKIGDRVTFHQGPMPNIDPHPHVRAEVVKVNTNGTVDLTYPHPGDPGIKATAEQVREGLEAWQFSQGGSNG